MVNQYTIDFHEKYQKCLKDINFQNYVCHKNNSIEVLNNIISKNSHLKKPNSIFLHLKNLIIEEKVYLIINENKNVFEFLVIDRNFNSVSLFIVVGTGTEEVSNTLIGKYEYFIEIDQLHSYKKGYGKLLLEYLKGIADNCQIPLALYDGTEYIEGYYEKLGFIPTKRLSEINEVYKVYYPSKLKWWKNFLINKLVLIQLDK